MEKENPIFLCGSRRSGTTVMGLMLKHHPQLTSPGEFDFLFDSITDDGSFPEVISYLNLLKHDRVFHSHQLNIDPKLLFKGLIESFVSQVGKEGNYLSLNVHGNFHRIPYIFPQARYIHLIRDARDVARSAIGMGWAGNVYYGVDRWIETENAWATLKPKLSSEQYIEVSYEELITDPEQTLSKVCNFIGVPYSDEMLNYSDKTTYTKPDTSLIRQWKRKQSRKEVQLVEAKAGEMMKELGYELSGYPLLKPGVIDKFFLYIQNRLGRVRFDFKHYGVTLFFAEQLTRRIPIFNRWHSNCLVRINEIEMKHLK